MIINFSRRIKLLMTKKKSTKKPNQEKQKDPQNLDMAKVFSQCNLFPVPYGNLYTLIKVLLWIANSEGPFPSVGCFFLLCMFFLHCTRNLSSLEYIVPVWLENLKREQPMLSFLSSMDQQETKAILVETGMSSWATLLGLCKERLDFN